MREPFRATAGRREDEKWSILSYYVTVLGRILRGPRKVLFILASGMHAVGHALVALVAGALAIGITGHAFPAGGAFGQSHFQGPRLANGPFSWSLVGLVVVFVKSLTGVYATFVQGRTAGDVGAVLRLELLDALLSVHRLRRPRHDDQGPGQVSATAQGVAALTERVHEVEHGLKLGFLGGLRAIAQLAPLVLVLVALSPRTALAASVVLGLFGAGLGRVRRGYGQAVARAARERTRLLEAADESVRHAELWVSYGAEAKARSVLRSLGQAVAARAARLDAWAAAMSGGNEVLGAVALVMAIGASSLTSFGAAVDGRTLLSFALAFFLAYRPLRELTEARLAIARAQGAYDELAPILAAAEHGHEEEPAPGVQGADLTVGGVRPTGEALANREQDVHAEGAPWSMAPLELCGLRLRNGTCGALTLRVEPGSIAVILGPTGVGKTTLLRTLLGLEPASAGQVLFGGVSIVDAPAGPKARPFAWVPQDAPLLADTLDANVALGTESIAACEALDPIGAAHLRTLLHGARLGATGRPVSGGERQWIALARAIATCQPVLLLDEPTSGLDVDSQRKVLEAISSLRGRRTVLLVTHRAEPLALADVVLHLSPDGAMREAA